MEETQTVDLKVSGMDCASCVAHVETAARGIPGVSSCAVNLACGLARVRFDPAKADPAAIAATISLAGYPSAIGSAADTPDNADASRGKWARRAIVGMSLWLPVEVLHWLAPAHWHAGLEILGLVTGSLALVLVGGGFITSAWAALRRGTSNMDTLISLGALVAYGYSLVAWAGTQGGLWPSRPLYFAEGTGLLAIISVGHWLEARSRTLAASSLKGLYDLMPRKACRIDAGTGAEQWVATADLEPGDTIIVRPGETIPADGIVTDGRSEVDESLLTGEAIPVVRSPGQNVVTGSINHNGSIRMQVTAAGEHGTLGQILALIETAQLAKPPVQRMADQIAAVFVPAVVLVALLTGAGWFAWGHFHGWAPSVTWGWVAQCMCSVLIIACPCALGLALPAALMVALAEAARAGILVRDAQALQSARVVDTVVFDKTGTLTLGQPRVVGVHPVAGRGDGELLGLAAAAETFSEHPIARAICAHARDRGLSLADMDEFQAVAGSGVRGTIAGAEVLVGNGEFVGTVPIPGGPEGATRVWVSSAGTVAGAIDLVDSIRPEAAGVVSLLSSRGVAVIMLTGDQSGVAHRVAREVGIQRVIAGVGPQGKRQAILDLRKQGRRVAMVGDGINDAPALAEALVGIAMGQGSDIARESGHIVLIRGDLRLIPQALELSKLLMGTIRTNFALAFVYNVLAIPLAAAGFLSPLVAAAAMGLSDVSVLGNALWLRRRLRSGCLASHPPAPNPVVAP